MPATSVHPLKKIARRIGDMLSVNAPVWLIAEKLEISEQTIRNHYGHVLEAYDLKAGNRPHIASPETKSKVKLLVIAGVPQVDIAKVLDISLATLTRHYRQEIDLAMIEANAKIAQKLFAMAMGPNEAKNTFLAAKWWSAARMGWKETRHNEMTGADGGPLQVENQVVVVLPSNDRDEPVLDVMLEKPKALEYDGEDGDEPESEGAVLPYLDQDDNESCR